MSETSEVLLHDSEQAVLTHNEKKRSRFYVSFKDFVDSFSEWRLWFYLSYADIRRRYRRTVIGPFWATLSMAIFIGAMGIIFSTLWHQRINHYLPFFASGFVVWTFFSTTLSESCSTFNFLGG